MENRSFRLIGRSFPLFEMFYHTLYVYSTPINLSYLWNFGSLALLTLVVQIVSGILLAMHYVPNALLAFDSVEHIMREVNSGWMLRYTHANGASIFFIVVYLHIFRGLYYGSYYYPRQLLWISGVVILFLMIIIAFMGYVLPWGQMSYWGATVITNLSSVIPLISQLILWWLWGSFTVDNATLNKFFSLHFFLPFILALLVVIHVYLLHQSGSGNPLGIDRPFFLSFAPYYVVKDYLGVIVYFYFFALLVFFAPNLLGHPDNYIPANPLVTPSHIVPEWYFLPFFAILRSSESKLFGVLLLLFSIIGLVLFAFFDRGCPPITRTTAFRPLFNIIYWFFLVICLFLGYIGGCEAVPPYIEISQQVTFLYFFFILVLVPLVKEIEFFIVFLYNYKPNLLDSISPEQFELVKRQGYKEFKDLNK